jgi:hypothetical protein
VNSTLYPKLGYDLLRDLAPITQATSQPYALIIHPSVPAQSLKDLIALARAKPEVINYGSSGNGGFSHLAGAMFASQAGVRLTHVPYRGGSPAMANYLQDRISIDGVSSVPKGEKRTGLEAEIISRRNGIEALGGQLKKICKDTSLSSNWKDLVRSNGSEIYLDQTIKILLIGKLSEVITATKDVAATQIVAADGKPLAFRIPAAIPLAGTQCGAVFLNLPDGGQLRVFPMRGTASESQTIVTLASDKSRMALQGAAQGDRDLLRNSNLPALVSQLQGQVLRLPLEGQ